MSSTKSFHLFNCDQTFPLGIVAELLSSVKDRLPPFCVEHHPFALSRMRALSEEVSKMKMDYAIFVVHAHESRLSINEENAGIGYAVLFKALLRATGNKVLVVIGGDDNYKNQDEEDTKVLSRWARHKIMSQFTEDFLDGSTSFIFSWEKNHRPIHEEALLHFLLLGNKGKKFEPKPRSPKPEPVVTPKNPAQVDVGRDNKLKVTGNQGEKSQPKHKPSKDEALFKHHTEEEVLPASKTSVGPKEPSHLQRDSDAYKTTSSTTQSLPARPDTEPANPQSSQTPVAQVRRTNSFDGLGQRTESEPVRQDSVIFVGCELEAWSRPGASQFYNEVTRELGLSKQADEGFYSVVTEAVEYLSRKTAKYCVIFMDKNIMDQLKDLPDRSCQYMRLLIKAQDNIGEKVFVVVCGDIDNKKTDRAVYSEKVKRQFDEYIVAPLLKDKFVLFTWNTSHYRIHVEYMLGILQSASLPQQPNMGRPLPTPDRNLGSHSGGTGRGLVATPVKPHNHPLQATCAEDDWYSWPDEGHAQNRSKSKPVAQGMSNDSQYNRGQPASNYLPQTFDHPVLVLKTLLRHGKISYDRRDVTYIERGFVAPGWLAERLWKTKRHVSSAVVEISRDHTGQLQPKVIEKRGFSFF